MVFVGKCNLATGENSFSSQNAKINRLQSMRFAVWLEPHPSEAFILISATHLWGLVTVVGGHEWKGLSCVVNIMTYFMSKCLFELFIHDLIMI